MVSGYDFSRYHQNTQAQGGRDYEGQEEEVEAVQEGALQHTEMNCFHFYVRQ
jgi:hypothetical protein